MKVTFADTDSKIAKLKEDGSYRVQNQSGLYLIKRGNSTYFTGKFRKNQYSIGVWKKEITVREAIQKWSGIKSWCKENNRLPKHYRPQIEDNPKTFYEVANEFMDEFYIPKNKVRTWKDRKNKLNQMLQYMGTDALISDYEIEQGGRERIKKMLKDLYESNDSHYQLVRCRQFLKQIFEYAESERYIRDSQNPVFKKFHWEGLKHEKKGSPTLAKTINSRSWGEVPKFLKSISDESSNATTITELAVKAHLLLCIRSGVVVRLEWDWYDAESDIWTIPAQTEGLKRKKDDSKNVHLIPSTPEINNLMDQIRAITGWQKYVFYSFNGKKDPHLGEETINDHLKNIGWAGKQSAHGWRDVITTGTLEHSDINYEIIDRQLGRLEHKQGTRSHYDESTLIDKRRKFMKWWSSEMIRQGLKI